jgi:uncharacterized membrane protein
MPEEKTAGAGLPNNMAGALCYLLGPVTGIIFLLLEKENTFIRFHAMQSTVVFGGLFVLNIFLGFIPILGWLTGTLLSLVGLVLWVVLLVKAYQGERYKLPYIGEIAEKQLGKIARPPVGRQ